MNIASNEMELHCAQWQSALLDTSRLDLLPSALLASVLDFAGMASRAGRADLAVALLETLVERAPRQARGWQRLGFAYGEQQRIPEAMQAFAQAVALEPGEPAAALAHARATLDAGLPAVALFEQAHRLAPDDVGPLAGWAASLAAQGQVKPAEALLADTLTRHPEWLAGHKALAALRYTSGERPGFDRSYADAVAAQPGNLQLRLAWFGVVAQTRHWDEALQIIVDGEKQLGAVPAFAAARAVIAGESGDLDGAEDLFARTDALRDDALRIARLRHCLRTRQWELAERLALAMLPGPAAPGIWPYLSLVWRLRGDARAQWLDGSPPYIRAFDLQWADGELDELAELLRRLHTARGPFVEQSVRGGTQTDTDRQLLFRAEPGIQRLRARITMAVREYVEGLPAFVPGHPLLGVPRHRILFAGSWSVRLTAHGFHVGHTHPMGWISSALYVALPNNPGAAPAGWISFGAAPAGLGLNLPPYARVEPKRGRLILFPSTMWHETLPFDAGERLVVAFDVMKPTVSRHA